MSINEHTTEKHDQLSTKHLEKLNKSDPEFIDLFNKFTFNEVLQHTSLDSTTRMKVTLASLIAMQCVNEYKEMMKEALSISVTPIEIKEIVYQSVPYAGFGKVIDILHATNEILTEHGIDLPLEGQSTTTSETRYDKGLEAVREAAGDKVDKMLESMPENQKHIATFLVDNCFGDYFTRGTLDAKERELLIFSILASMGGAEPQLKGHIGNNVRVGNDKQTLIDTITVLLPFIGYPRTLTALTCINEVIAEN